MNYMKTLKLIALLFVLPLSMNGQQVLDGIQDSLLMALNYSFPAQENKVAPLIQQLADAQAHAEKPNPWLNYWQAYGHYYEGIYFMKIGQKDKGIAALRSGVDLLESQDKLNSEEHVMVATLMGLLMGLSPGEVMSLSAKSGKHLQKGVKMDPQNHRAHLALGKSDFYTPEMYGGGKKVEEHLLKALSLQDKHLDDPHAPSWGRNETYMFLVQYYQREDRMDEAKLYCKKGLKEFPQDYMLNQLDKQL